MLFFDFNKWIKRKNVVVHCKTLKEATEFINILKENNWEDKIKDAPEYSEYVDQWQEYKENTCYNLNNGCFGNLYFYKNYKKYTILEWSDYMFTTPKATLKTMLQNHDIVVTKNQGAYMYYADLDIFINSRGYNSINSYDENLMMIDSDFNIVEIRRPKSNSQFVEIHWGDAEVIWKRPEVVEMTLEEICEALGKNVKIVNSKK